jgi:hypothetical protein
MRSSSARTRSISERGRQTKSGGPQLVQRKPPVRSDSLLQATRHEIFYRWMYRDWKTRSIAASFGIPCDVVEEVVKGELRGKRGPDNDGGGAAAMPFRRAA